MIRAVLFASATVTSMRGFLASICSSHEPRGAPRLLAWSTTALLPMINNLRSVRSPKVVIRRGSAVTGTITWKTGRAVGGKSGKFEVTFNSVSVGGRSVTLTGKHRQEGRGNSVGALLGSMVISGRSAVMLPGDLVNVFTGQDFVYY